MAKERKNIWFRLIMVLILSAMMTVMLVRPIMADRETERFTITCNDVESVFIHDYIGDYPFEVSVRNNGSDFSGVIKLMMYTGSDMDEVAAYVQTAVIPSGNTAVFKFCIQNIYFEMSSYVIPVRIEFLDKNGNQIYCQMLDFQAASEGGATILGAVVSENDQISQLMNGSGFDYDTAYAYGRVTMLGTDMTSEDIISMDLSRMDMFIMDMDVTDEAWRKISEWLVGGGHLMMNREVFDDRVGKKLDEDHMASWGTGRILVYDEGDKWNGAMLIRSVRNLFGPAGISELMDGSGSSYWMVSNQLGYDMWSKEPGIGGYTIVLIVYILLIGPAAYLLLSRKKDRRAYLWGTIPCLAVIFSLIIYQMGNLTRYTDAFIRYGSVVKLSDEGMVENTDLLVTVPEKEHTMITLEGECELCPVFEDCYWNDNQDLERVRERLMMEEYDLAVASSENCTELLFNSNSVFDKFYFSVSRILESKGELKADLYFYRGCFTGTVTNSAQWDLNNVFIAYQGIGLVLGDLAAGQTISLNQAEGDTVLLYSDSLNLDPDSYGKDANQNAVEWIMRNLIDNSSILRDSRSMVIGGFTEGYDIGIENSGQIESVNGMALIIQDISVTSSGSGWSSLAIVRGTGVSDEDKMNYDSYTYAIYNNDVIDLDYQMDMAVKPDYIKWMNYSEFVYLEFYNYKTGTYEQVFTESAFMEGDSLAPYLDEEYCIRARVQVEDGDYSQYIPSFTVTGGEYHD